MITSSLDFNKISNNVLKDVDKATSKMLDSMIDDITPYVPYKTGELNSSVEVDYNNKVIAYNDSKAEYVYNMPTSNKFNRNVHKKATSHWLEVAKAECLPSWLDVLHKSMRGD